MKRYIFLISCTIYALISYAQTIQVVIDSVTTTAAYTDNNIGRLHYHIRISSDSITQVCDTFAKISSGNTWDLGLTRTAATYSSVFGFAFYGDTIWSDKSGKIANTECYTSLENGISTTITMSLLYLPNLYYRHSELWPSLNHLARFFVSHAQLFLYFNGEYYTAIRPQNLQITYRSNKSFRIEE